MLNKTASLLQMSSSVDGVQWTAALSTGCQLGAVAATASRVVGKNEWCEIIGKNEPNGFSVLEEVT